MGETDRGGNWVLFWWTVFNKSLIQFSVDGWGCVPSLYLKGSETESEVAQSCQMGISFLFSFAVHFSSFLSCL